MRISIPLAFIELTVSVFVIGVFLGIYLFDKYRSNKYFVHKKYKLFFFMIVSVFIYLCSLSMTRFMPYLGHSNYFWFRLQISGLITFFIFSFLIIYEITKNEIKTIKSNIIISLLLVLIVLIIFTDLFILDTATISSNGLVVYNINMPLKIIFCSMFLLNFIAFIYWLKFHSRKNSNKMYLKVLNGILISIVYGHFFLGLISLCFNKIFIKQNYDFLSFGIIIQLIYFFKYKFFYKNYS